MQYIKFDFAEILYEINLHGKCALCLHFWCAHFLAFRACCMASEIVRFKHRWNIFVVLFGARDD